METEPSMTNAEFARRVGCHYTMASRLRNGERTPSAEMLAKIVNAFKTQLSTDDIDAMFDALTDHEDESAKAQAFGAWLRDHIFERASATG